MWILSSQFNSVSWGAIRPRRARTSLSGKPGSFDLATLAFFLAFLPGGRTLATCFFDGFLLTTFFFAAVPLAAGTLRVFFTLFCLVALFFVPLREDSGFFFRVAFRFAIQVSHPSCETEPLRDPLSRSPHHKSIAPKTRLLPSIAQDRLFRYEHFRTFHFFHPSAQQF